MMKKFIALVLVGVMSFMMIGIVSAGEVVTMEAEESLDNGQAQGFDLTAMSDEELLALKDMVEQELKARGITGAVFKTGMYVCGVDIREGTYAVTNIGTEGNVEFATGTPSVEEEGKYDIGIHMDLKAGESVQFTLTDGMMFAAEGTEGGIIMIEEASNPFAP